MKLINSIALLLLAAVLTAPALDAGEARFQLQDHAAVDRVIDGFVEAGAFPFVYVRLEDRDGAVIYQHAAVNEGLMQGHPVNGDSWIRIWSMSKIVTISVTLDLVEDGILSLDDPVKKFIPEFAGLKVAVSASGEDLSRLKNKQGACPLRLVATERDMTVRDLLKHQAGFYYPWTQIECLDARWAESDMLTSANSDELIARLAELPLINQPGANSYYGTGTTVLGLLAERASGQSLKRLVAERVAGPLGIEGLQYTLPEGALLPPTFSGEQGEVRRIEPEQFESSGIDLPDYSASSELYLGGEGMVATADGYADFARMLMRRGELNGHRFLEASTVDEIAAPHTQLDNPFGHNGYNLWVSNGRTREGDQGPAPLWIGGGYEGTHFWIDPERGFVGVVMSQILHMPETGYGRDDAIRKAVYEQLVPAAAE